jgi:manganese/zinc/iron transport system permease protein
MIAAATTVIGYYLATQVPYLIGLDVSLNASGMMLVTAGIVFTSVTLFAPRYGVLAQWISQRRLSSTIILEDILGILYRVHEKSVETSGPSETDSSSSSGSQMPTLEDIRRRLPHPCTDQQLSRAIDQGYRQGLFVKTAIPEVQLSATGKKRALNLIRSHRLWETYLLENTDLDSTKVHKPAESLEHITSPHLQEELAAQTNRQEDPHEKKIP